MIAIGRNDASLAHGAARTIHAGQTENANRHFGRVVDSTSVKQMLASLRKYFAEQIVHVRVDRATGSRAKGSVILMVPWLGSDFSMIVVKFDARRDPMVRICTPPIRIDRHAVARGLQRTIGRSDMTELGRRAFDHLATAGAHAVAWDRERVAPTDVSIAGRGIALLCSWDGRQMTVGTWLDGATAADPHIRRLAASEDITIRFSTEV